jgi:hypothetical protein
VSETGQAIITVIRRIASEQPDFVYKKRKSNDCTYVKKLDGQPVGDCGVGRALVELELIEPQDFIDNERINTKSFRWLCGLMPFGTDLSEREITWINRFQMYQDEDYAWSTAVQFTDSEV